LGRKNINTAELFEQQVEKHPNKACLLFEDQQWTFKEVNLPFNNAHLKIMN
jgi:solute carrier family 27 fatty acid transporter 1/4